MKKLILFIVILFHYGCFSQEEPQLVLQEFHLDGTLVYNNGGDEWVFIDKVYSNLNLKENVYMLNNEISLKGLLSDVSSDRNLKNQYYLCDIYEFSEYSGLILKAQVLSKNLNMFKEWKKSEFKYLKENMKIQKFECDSRDLIINHIIYAANISEIKIVIEDIDQDYYLSIFNNKCLLFDKIKTNKKLFSFFETDKYFILKTDKLLILFSTGKGLSSK